MASGTSISDIQNGRALRTWATVSAGRVRNVVMHGLLSWHEILEQTGLQLLFQMCSGKVKHLAHHGWKVRGAKRRGRVKAAPQGGGILRDPGDADRQPQMEMREGVARLLAQVVPLRLDRWGWVRGRGGGRGGGGLGPIAAGAAQDAAQETLVGAGFQQPRAIC